MPVTGQVLTGRAKAFFEYLAGPCALDGTKAAAQAGYKHPQKAGHRLRKAWPELAQEAEVKFRASMVMSSREVDERLAAVARDPTHKDHVKALELLARMHGKLETKLLVGSIDRPTLNKQLDTMLESLTAQRAVETKQLPAAKPLPERITERDAERDTNAQDPIPTR